MNLVKELFSKLFGKEDGNLTCPRCGKKLIPLPIYDGDIVNGVRMGLNPNFIHFSCLCGYVFARQYYNEFKSLAVLLFDTPALNYPDKDLQGGILPPMYILHAIARRQYANIRRI